MLVGQSLPNLELLPCVASSLVWRLRYMPRLLQSETTGGHDTSSPKPTTYWIQFRRSLQELQNRNLKPDYLCCHASERNGPQDLIGSWLQVPSRLAAIMSHKPQTKHTYEAHNVRTSQNLSTDSGPDHGVKLVALHAVGMFDLRRAL